MANDQPPRDAALPRNKGGRPPVSSAQQLRRDAIFLALSALYEMGAIPIGSHASRLANLVADESTDASLELEARGLIASFTPPPNLSSSKLDHAKKYTAQRVNGTVKDRKWGAAEVASLAICSEAIIQMFLAPVHLAVDIVAAPLAQEGWPSAVVARLAGLAKAWGAKRPGYFAPTPASIQAMSGFLAHVKKERP